MVTLVNKRIVYDWLDPSGPYDFSDYRIYPYCVRYDYFIGDVKDIRNWCRMSLKFRYLVNPIAALFEDESDMMLFMLRW